MSTLELKILILINDYFYLKRWNFSKEADTQDVGIAAPYGENTDCRAASRLAMTETIRVFPVIARGDNGGASGTPPPTKKTTPPASQGRA
jgi:hypothetical protein